MAILCELDDGLCGLTLLLASSILVPVSPFFSFLSMRFLQFGHS